MKNRSVSNSTRLKEIKKKKRTNIRNKFVVIFIAVVLLFGGLAYFSSLSKINIKNIEIVGSKVIDKEPILNLVTENISGKYMLLFPKTNFLIYPKNKIEERLVDSFHRMKDISFNLKDTETLEISFKEREPKYIWCGESLPEGEIQDDLKCYFMDDTGYLFDESPFFSGEVYFRFFGPITNIEHPKGSSYKTENFQNLILFKDNLFKLDIKPTSLLIKEDGDIEIILTSSFPLINAPRIVFKSDSDLNKMAENLQSALAVDPLKTDFDKKYKSLKYIDLRFGNKVYYKF